MKTVMIYFPKRKLNPKGGPAGYLYNLCKGLQHVKHHGLDILFYENASISLEENQSLRNHIPNRLKEMRRAFKYSNYLKKALPVDPSLFKYDAIHFHTTEDMYLNRELLSRYNGKVLLTSHTPCVSYLEIIERLNKSDYKFFKKKIDSLIEIDKYAFQRADYIIFPCEEAEEPYYHTWPDYKKLKDPLKMKYIPTGISECIAKVTKENIRSKYKIPKDAFLISYVGRHNEIKGFLDLMELGKMLLNKHKDVYFLIAGRQGPLYGLKDERWIEVGWTNDPHSLIAASDIFILPNKETYFDLVLLEVMSLGVPVIMSNTGGNKYFKRFNAEGLFFYNNVQDCYDLLCKIKQEGCIHNQEIQNELKEIFKNNFSLKIFSLNYIKAYQNILNVK